MVSSNNSNTSKKFKLKFRINSKDKASILTFGTKEKIIVGLIAIVFIITSALKHSIKSMKSMKSNGKKNSRDDDVDDSDDDDDDDDDGDRYSIDKESGLPFFIKNIIMPSVHK